MKRKKIIAVASIGGHWVQLLRIAKPLEQWYDVAYMSTHEKCQTMIGEKHFYRLPDFNRSNAWKMLVAIFKCFYVVLKERPSAVIARFFWVETIWIDSVANVKTLSACGHFARFFAKHVYTQWPDLADDSVDYVGNIFGDQGEDK